MDYTITSRKNGFAVHASNCPKRGRWALPVKAEELEETVADAREREHVVWFCKCTREQA